MIEWAEKAKNLLPNECLQVNIKAFSECRRRFSISSKEKKYNALLKLLTGKIKQHVIVGTKKQTEKQKLQGDRKQVKR